MSLNSGRLPPIPSPSATAAPEAPFGPNPLRLGGRQWLAVLAALGALVVLSPRLWERAQRFDIGPDYRIPYALSADYWLYACRFRQPLPTNAVVFLGDSVVWGEYVRRDGTLSHFLDREVGEPDRFVNAGMNGLFPLALDGLIRDHAPALRNRRVLLHCNLLWLTSPKADLSTQKEESFNHSRLVPQFFPRIPCYRADVHTRLGILVERSIAFFAWVPHLQHACFDQQSLPNWTLADDGREPPRHPNATRNPLDPLTLDVPGEPPEDPQRGPRSPRHKPWSASNPGTTRFDWVDLDASLQWRAFRQLVERLSRRGNDVRVLLGPFNEHLLADADRPAYRRLRDGVRAWLAEHRVPCAAPDPLPSPLYADASHPLTDGYALLAQRLRKDPAFRDWFDPR